MTRPAFFYITTPDADLAESIGEALVEQRIAACANVLPEMRSVYRWEGVVEKRDEAVLIVKSTLERAEELRDAVARLHPDDTPCVVALPIEEAASSPDFLAWVRAESLRTNH